MTLDLTLPLTSSQLANFYRDGYTIVRALFSPDDLREIVGECDALHARGEIPGCFKAVPADRTADPLQIYPRMLYPHRVSPTLKRYMLHPPLEPLLRALLGETPIAAQSMFYWKPPGARGQAFHQDNFYLRVHPGTCLAAWVAVDRADEDNGCLFVAPGSQRLDVFCPEEDADLEVSFTKHIVPVPAGLDEVPVVLDPGDVLFFGGNLIHGSRPNRTADRFRRSFICHYVGESAREIGRQDLHRFDHTEVRLPAATGAGPCGEYEAKPH